MVTVRRVGDLIEVADGLYRLTGRVTYGPLYALFGGWLYTIRGRKVIVARKWRDTGQLVVEAELEAEEREQVERMVTRAIRGWETEGGTER